MNLVKLLRKTQLTLILTFRHQWATVIAVYLRNEDAHKHQILDIHGSSYCQVLSMSDLRLSDSVCQEEGGMQLYIHLFVTFRAQFQF